MNEDKIGEIVGKDKIVEDSMENLFNFMKWYSETEKEQVGRKVRRIAIRAFEIGQQYTEEQQEVTNE